MLTMYDAITVDNIPKDAKAVAGYIGGRWPTYQELLRRFPNAHKLSIAVASRYDADCADVEVGDLPNALVPNWVRRQQARGLHKPAVYTSVSNARALLNVLSQSGIKRGDVRLWTAHYTGRPHLCGPICGFGMNTTADATQYTDRALGRALDASLVTDGFFASSGTASTTTPHKRKLWRGRQAKDTRTARGLRSRLIKVRKRIAKRVKLLRRK